MSKNVKPGKEHIGGAMEDARIEAGDPPEEIAVMGDKSQASTMKKEKS